MSREKSYSLLFMSSRGAFACLANACLMLLVVQAEDLWPYIQSGR